jgi:hypothetical protein
VAATTVASFAVVGGSAYGTHRLMHAWIDAPETPTSLFHRLRHALDGGLVWPVVYRDAYGVPHRGLLCVVCEKPAAGEKVPPPDWRMEPRDVELMKRRRAFFVRQGPKMKWDFELWMDDQPSDKDDKRS